MEDLSYSGASLCDLRTRVMGLAGEEVAMLRLGCVSFGRGDGCL